MKHLFNKKIVNDKTQQELDNDFDSLLNDLPTVDTTSFEDTDTNSNIFKNSHSSNKYNQSKWYFFRGRICRVQFLAYFTIWSSIIFIIFSLLISVVGFDIINPNAVASVGFLGGFLLLILGLVSLYAYVVLHSRRLHDLNLSSFFILLLFIPIANICLSLFLAFTAGKAESNRFGRAPKPFTELQYKLAFPAPMMYLVSVSLVVLILLSPEPESIYHESVASISNAVVTSVDSTNDLNDESVTSLKENQIAIDSVSNEVVEPVTKAVIEPVINLPISDGSWQDVSTHTDSAYDNIDGFLNQEGEQVFTEE